MKKSILMMAALLMAVGLSVAQQRGRGFGNPEENAKRMTGQLEKELGLSATQKDSVYAYTLAQSKAMHKAFQENKENDRRQTMGKMRELREQTNKKILAVLNDDQKQAYQKLMEERENRMRQNRGRRGTGGNRQ